jgi:thiol-disulfide isomerase/thioredoxin
LEEPDFRLKDLKGAEVSLGDFIGKVVLVDFWATWCGPCRQEMPEFQNIHRAGKDVVVLTLDVDEPIETVAAYVEKEKFTFPVLLAKDTDVVRRYSVAAYPTTFAIDKKGLVAEVLLGGAPDRLQAVIEKARAGAPAPAQDSAPVPAVTSARGPVPPTSAENAEDFYRDAVRQHNSKDYADAIRSLDRALELHPNWLLAIVSRADNQYHSKQYAKAIADFDSVLHLEPANAQAASQKAADVRHLEERAEH